MSEFDGIEEVDLSLVDWKATAENMQREINRLTKIEGAARGFVHAVDRGRALGVKNLGHPIIDFQQLRRATGIGPVLGDTEEPAA